MGLLLRGCRFVLPPHLTLKNFEGLDLGTMDQAADSGLASYVAGQIDRTLSWKDVKWLQTITTLPILVKGVVTAEDCTRAHHRPLQFSAALLSFFLNSIVASLADARGLIA
jgi:hypothetical protein